MDTSNQSLIIDEVQAGSRLDVFLSAQLPHASRSQWKGLIADGLVKLNGETCKPNHKLQPGDRIDWALPSVPPDNPLPEPIPLDILYEDDAVIVINKPPGLVVHPAAGNETGTLVNALLFHDPVFAQLDRAGLVHRLDKDTSGVMVAAKTSSAMESLQEQFKQRLTEKEYLALVWGTPPPSGRIETQIGRHPVNRKKQAVLKQGGREAVSEYRLEEVFAECSLIRVKIETGRTHQIRVHMAHLGHPVAGDSLYGRMRKHQLPLQPERQMLHAVRLSFNHPDSGKRLSFDAPLSDDMNRLLERLRET